MPPLQLFDLSSDIGEQHNLQADHPEIVHQLTSIMEKYVAEGRSTRGSPQKNDVAVDFRRGERIGPPMAKNKAKAAAKGK
jgi:hypothetical protein